jgi:hypothetical protein
LATAIRIDFGLINKHGGTPHWGAVFFLQLCLPRRLRSLVRAKVLLDLKGVRHVDSYFVVVITRSLVHSSCDDRHSGCRQHNLPG